MLKDDIFVENVYALSEYLQTMRQDPSTTIYLELAFILNSGKIEPCIRERASG